MRTAGGQRQGFSGWASAHGLGVARNTAVLRVRNSGHGIAASVPRWGRLRFGSVFVFVFVFVELLRFME